MATFTFWYSETYTNKGWFEADNLEHAKQLLRQIEQGEICFDELPEWGDKCKGYELEVSPETLEKVED